MIAGKTVNQLAETILEQSRGRRDFLADTRKLEIVPPVNTTKDKDGRLIARPEIALAVNGAKVQFPLSNLCLEQIGERVGIPAKYLERMATEAPQLLAQNVNHWFTNSPEKRLLRTFDNGHKLARAFLSDRYRKLENADLAQAVLPKLEAAGCRIESAEVTEKRLYIQAVTPRLEAVIQARKAEGTAHRIGEANDIVQAGIVISNSEVGCGAVRIEPMIFRLVCRNGLILPTALRKHHVGRAGDGAIGGDAETAELFSDETRKLDDAAFWAKVCDVVDGALDEMRFNKNVDKMNAAGEVELGNPVEVVEIAADKFELSETEKESVLEHLTRGGDLSRYGLLNAVTRTAEDAGSYDRAIELERLGGTILELPNSAFTELLSRGHKPSTKPAAGVNSDFAQLVHR